MGQVDIAKDNSEIVHYNYPGLGIYAKYGQLSNYNEMHALGHWHEDIELIYITRGRMGYFINEVQIVLEEKQGLFVNSRQMHYGYSCDGSDCQFLCVLIHPEVLCQSAWNKEHYVDPVCGNAQYPYLHLRQNSQWNREIMMLTELLTDCMNREADGFSLKAMALSYTLWETLYRNYQSIPNCASRESAKDLDSLQAMVRYIQTNYSERLTLSMIAASGNVCRSDCCRLFQTIAHTTPITYLSRYRISKSTELLRDTQLPVTEIALQCGFSVSSYFSETFRREMDCTPREYRRMKP